MSRRIGNVSGALVWSSALNDVLRHQRHTDIGELGDQKAAERERDPAAEVHRDRAAGY